MNEPIQGETDKPTVRVRKKRNPLSTRKRGPSADATAPDPSKEAEDSSRPVLEPPSPALPFFVVGIGASAGGLDALARFFAKMDPAAGLAYIVIQHLSPDHRSFMVELLSRRTPIPVCRAQDGSAVEANHIYLIPPGNNLAIRGGKLRLSRQEQNRGLNMPIDFFFQSMAEAMRHRAIGVILSGTGSDGTMGVRAIKDLGGMVMVQSESTAQFTGMPRSAMGTGLADYVLAPETMPEQLQTYIQHPFVAREGVLSRTASSTDAAMERVFRILRERCGADFSHYKPATIDRRIERRMSVNQVEHLDDYVAVLDSSTKEAGILFNEFLISVTRFFRDKSAWDHLETSVLPTLFERATAERQIRIWVPACATGEEAYSFAVLLLNEAEKHAGQWDIKIFATDLSRTALDIASAGLYPESVMTEVPQLHLERYFDKQDDGYRVREHLRRAVIFARHDLLKDPPFTKLDLVSCRNVLIYFQADIQARVIGLLQFSLKSEGILFLGHSESVGDLIENFDVISSRHRLYKNRSAGRSRSLQMAMPVSTSDQAHRPHTPARPSRPYIDLSTLEHIYRDALSEYATACIVVDEHLDVIHLLGNAGEYLRQPSGTITSNLLRLTGHNLSSALATALHRAEKSGGTFTYNNVNLASPKSKPGKTLQIRIKTITLGQRGSVRLILLEEKASDPVQPSEIFEVDRTAAQRIFDLEQDLNYTKESLQATIEELETSNEELQATNEELLASNEELQSTNEELQSVNEELHTVNSENLSRIEELAELNDDITNLLAASYVGTMLVDSSFRIRRLSATTARLTGLSTSDINAPLEVLDRTLQGIQIIPQAQSVLRQGISTEIETAKDDRFLLLRLSPYRTQNQEIQGLVITIIDITQRKLAENALTASEALTRGILDSVGEHVAVIDPNGVIVRVNEPWMRFAADNGCTDIASISVGANYFDACQKTMPVGEVNVAELITALKEVMSGKRSAFQLEYSCNAPHKQRWFCMHAMPLVDVPGLVISHFDITERKLAEAERLEWERQLQQTQKLESLGVLAGGIAHDFNNLLSNILVNTAMVEKCIRPETDGDRRLMAIKTSVTRAVDLCKQMLAYAGKGQFPLRPTDLNSIISETADLLQVSISQKALLDFDLSPTRPTAFGDPTQLRQIVMNLLLNASDALGENSGRIRITTGTMKVDFEYFDRCQVVPDFKGRTYSFLEISDEGCGMSPETCKRILEPFFTTKFIGRGLGLSAIAGILRRHNGALHITTEPNKGSAFRILLPPAPLGNLDTHSNADSDSATAFTPQSQPPQPQTAVLVIDPDPTIAGTLGKMLYQIGFNPVVVNNAREGLIRFNQLGATICAVLMDWNLAHPEGAQPFRQAIELHPEVPVVLLSNLEEDEIQRRIRGLHISGYLLKPVELQALQEKMEELTVGHPPR